MPMRTALGFVAYVADTGEGKPVILKGAQGKVYSVNDVGLTTPLACRDLATEAVIPNPVSNEDGFIPPFKVSISEASNGVLWKSGEYAIYQPFLGVQGQRGKDGTPGVGIIPTDEAIKSIIETPGTLTGDLLDARFGALAQAYVSVGSIVVNVIDYGAYGDGITDDTGAVIAARDALALAGGGTLFFPAGKVYRLAGSVDLVSNMKVSATGATLRKLGPTDTYSVFVARSNGAKGYGSSVQNVVFEGGTYRGSFEDGTTTGIAVSLHHAQNVTFRDIAWTEAVVSGHIADLAGCDNVTFERCTVNGWKVHAGREYTEAIQIDYSTRMGLGIEELDSSYDGLPTRNVTVRGSQFLPLTIGATTYPAPNPMGNHTRVEDRIITNIVFERNLVHAGRKTDDLTSGLEEYFHGWLHFFFTDGVYIRNNTFLNESGRACKIVNMRSPSTATMLADVANENPISGSVTVRTPRNVEITGNLFQGFDAANTEDLIYIFGYDAARQGHGVTVDNNTFVDCTPAAFEKFTDTGQTGLQAKHLNRVSFSGNTFDGIVLPFSVKDSAGFRAESNDGVNVSHMLGYSTNTSRVKLNGNDTRSAGGVYLYQCAGVQAYGNEFDAFAGTTGGTSKNALLAMSGCTNVSGSDNHFTNTSGNTWIKYGAYIYGSSQAGTLTNTIGTGTFDTDIVGIAANSSTITQAGTITGAV